MSDAIRFIHRGTVQAIEGAAPTRTVLQYLREDAHCTGTKEGCAEGDCGACTVVVGELRGDSVDLRTVNSCIQLIPSLDGKALFTVEDLRQPDGGLHPVQQAMVNCHGSQCGFCTPGFVMSLWGLYLSCESSECGEPQRAEIDDALSGNLCRCTGYRPIIDAARQMLALPVVPFDRVALAHALRGLQRDTMLDYTACGAHFYAPHTLEELIELRSSKPDACLLAGSTDVGLWVTKQLRDLGDIIYLGRIEALRRIAECNGMLEIGAAVSLRDAYDALCRHYPDELTEFRQRFASQPIRNAGTLGGNVANGSPIGDSMPWMIALGAEVVLHGRSGQRAMPLEDFYLGYQQKDLQPDEFVEAVRIPLPRPGRLFRTYKLAKRFDQDISAVCAAFALTIVNGHIADARIAYGGMAGTPKRAAHAEAVLRSQAWEEHAVHLAMKALESDYAPLSDMRASSAYRMKAAQNLLYRFWLETRVEVPLPKAAVDVFAAQ